MVNFDDFLKLELRVGRVLGVEPHPDAEKLYILKVDIGTKTVQLVAGIKPFYAPADLEGKMIAVLVNLEPKHIRGLASEGMLLAASDKGNVSLLVPDKEVSPGSPIR